MNISTNLNALICDAVCFLRPRVRLGRGLSLDCLIFANNALKNKGLFHKII